MAQAIPWQGNIDPFRPNEDGSAWQRPLVSTQNGVPNAAAEEATILYVARDRDLRRIVKYIMVIQTDEHDAYHSGGRPDDPDPDTEWHYTVDLFDHTGFYGTHHVGPDGYGTRNRPREYNMPRSRRPSRQAGIAGGVSQINVRPRITPAGGSDAQALQQTFGKVPLASGNIVSSSRKPATQSRHPGPSRPQYNKPVSRHPGALNNIGQRANARDSAISIPQYVPPSRRYAGLPVVFQQAAMHAPPVKPLSTSTAPVARYVPPQSRAIQSNMTQDTHQTVQPRYMRPNAKAMLGNMAAGSQLDRTRGGARQRATETIGDAFAFQGFSHALPSVSQSAGCTQGASKASFRRPAASRAPAVLLPTNANQSRSAHAPFMPFSRAAGGPLLRPQNLSARPPSIATQAPAAAPPLVATGISATNAGASRRPAWENSKCPWSRPAGHCQP